MDVKKMKRLDRTVDMLLKIADLYRQVCESSVLSFHRKIHVNGQYQNGHDKN